jgi:hypothetical protein
LLCRKGQNRRRDRWKFPGRRRWNHDINRWAHPTSKSIGKIKIQLMANGLAISS